MNSLGGWRGMEGRGGGCTETFSGFEVANAHMFIVDTHRKAVLCSSYRSCVYPNNKRE